MEEREVGAQDTMGQDSWLQDEWVVVVVGNSRESFEQGDMEGEREGDAEGVRQLRTVVVVVTLVMAVVVVA